MGLWLFKEEPTHYSFADLEAEGRTTWEGVRNALALQHLRAVRRGDRVLFYHTGKEKAIVGEMRVREAAGPGSDPPAVEVEAVRRLDRPVTLALIKADPVFAGWELVRIPRLSVMPVTPEQWRQVEELGQP
jgi:predicted RNA-binding protein with PUA-like domain